MKWLLNNSEGLKKKKKKKKHSERANLHRA